jgi:hypothetical protein
VSVGLEQPVELAEESLRSNAVAAYAEVEDDTLAGRAILPHVRLMIALLSCSYTPTGVSSAWM